MTNISHLTKRIMCLLMALMCLVSITACNNNAGGTPVTPATPDTIPAITEKPKTPETDTSNNTDNAEPDVGETVVPDTSEPTPDTTPDNTEKPAPQPIVHTLTFVGDCTLGTMPDWESYERCFNNVIKDNYLWPFANVVQYFSNDDCTFINLESVLANTGIPEKKEFTFKGPVKYVNILTQNSVEFANLSNNHTYDFGDAGYASTTETLANNSIAYVGRKSTALYTTNSGLRIGVYGVYFSLDEKDMKQDVQFLIDNGADIIVAAVHWGIEREYLPNNTQKSIAHKLIDAGVDIVWGHHPHVLQPIEQYKDGVIYYSLGNFSFGGNHNPSDKDTVIIQQTIIQEVDGSCSLGTMNAIPCRLSSKTNYNDFKPTPYLATDDGYMRVLQKLNLTNTTQPAPEGSTSGSATAPDTNTTTPENKPEKPVETLQDKIKNGKVVLRRSFGFYKGSAAINTITKITFSRSAPESYDEKWYANLAQTSDITGYRKGNEVYIVGEHIYMNEYAGYMFARLNSYDAELWGSLQSVEGLELLNLSTCKQTTCMFYEQKWDKIDGIENWDMSKITSIQMMFSHCTNLTTLEIGTWNTSNVQNFSGLFSGNSWAGDMKLKYLPLENWDTSAATDMSHMFYGCAELEYIPLENWNVSNVTNFSHTFADCYKLNNLDFSRWDTHSVVNFDAFLNDCHALVTIDVSGLDTESCQQFSQMFEACINLEEIIGIDKWDVSNASNAAFQQMFNCCYTLKELNVPHWVGTPDDIARMFSHCYKLEYVNISGLDLSQLTWVQETFWECAMLKEIVWNQHYDFSDIEGFDSMYKHCNPNVKQTVLD